MKKYGIRVCIWVVLCIIGIGVVIFNYDQKKKKSVEKRLYGADVLWKLDENSYDVEVSCIKCGKNTLTTSAKNYDGDEKDRFKLKKRAIEKKVGIIDKDSVTVMNVEKKTKEVKTKYKLLTWSEFSKLVNSNVYGVTAKLWLNEKRECRYILVDSEREIQK